MIEEPKPLYQMTEEELDAANVNLLQEFRQAITLMERIHQQLGRVDRERQARKAYYEEAQRRAGQNAIS